MSDLPARRQQNTRQERYLDDLRTAIEALQERVATLEAEQATLKETWERDEATDTVSLVNSGDTLNVPHIDADTVDGYHASVLGGHANVVRATFAKQLPDNVTTPVFRIVTTDEPGDNDAGGYSCSVRSTFINGSSPGSEAVAVFTYIAVVQRAMRNTGMGSSAIPSGSTIVFIQYAPPTSTDYALRSFNYANMLATDVAGLAENGEYEALFRLKAVHTGSLAPDHTVICVAELSWWGFLTPPQLLSV
jgi:hypothetical protein